MNFTNQPFGPGRGRGRGSSNFTNMDPEVVTPPNTLSIYDDLTVIDPAYFPSMLAPSTPSPRLFYGSTVQTSNRHLEITQNNNIRSVDVRHNQIPQGSHNQILQGSHNHDAFRVHMPQAGAIVDQDRTNVTNQSFTPDTGSSNFRNLHSQFGMPSNNILTVNNMTVVNAANSSMQSYSFPLGPQLKRDESFQIINSLIASSSNLHSQRIHDDATNNIPSLDFGHNQIAESSHYDASCTQIQGVGYTVDHDRPNKRKMNFANQSFVPDNGFPNFTYTNPPPWMLSSDIMTSNDNVANAENGSSMQAHALFSGMQLNKDESLQNYHFSVPSLNPHLQMIHSNATNNIPSLDIKHNQIPESLHIYGAPAIETQGAGNTVDNERPNKKIRNAESSGIYTRKKCCNCKKSRCLQRYCPCFGNENYCINPCSYNQCHNSAVYEDMVLSARLAIKKREPDAFDHKVISADRSDHGETEVTSKASISARHRRGCNCKKSNCGNNYCECHAADVRCSELCRCVGCKNGTEKEGNKIKLEEQTKDENLQAPDDESKLEAETKDENLHAADDKSKLEVRATNDLEKQDDSIHEILNQTPISEEDHMSSTAFQYPWPPSPLSASMLGIAEDI